MSKNIEIKASVDDVESLSKVVESLASFGPEEIDQDDTFFKCDNGRLKLRALGNGHGKLIFYRRPDRDGPKESFYVISETSSPDSLREALTLAYGQVGRVRKHRVYYLIGQTAVHLDYVEGLGHFMELEVPMENDGDADIGMREARHLMDILSIPSSRLVSGAYVDMINSRLALTVATPSM